MPFPISFSGQNSVQTVSIDEENVKVVKVTFSGEGAVTFIRFCSTPETPAPQEPTPSEPSEPSVPTVSPPSEPSEPSVPSITPPTPSEPSEPSVPSITPPTSSVPSEPSVPSVTPPTPSEPSEPSVTPPTPSSQTGKIKGVVYEDTNGNGVQDPGEPGIRNVSVVITDSSGASQTVTTTRNGMYMATVPPGATVTDIVESTLPPGYVQTGGEDPSTVVVPVDGTATDSDGFQILGKVKGVVYEDINGNGSQDDGEPGLEGVDVVITDSLGGTITLTTDSTGMYMADVPVGPTVTDIVESTLPDGALQTGGSDPSTVIVPGGGTATDSDGFQIQTSTPTKAPSIGTPTLPPSPGGETPAPTDEGTLPPSFEGYVSQIYNAVLSH